MVRDFPIDRDTDKFFIEPRFFDGEKRCSSQAKSGGGSSSAASETAKRIFKLCLRWGSGGNGIDSAYIPTESRDTLKKAYQFLNAQMENYMQNGKINPVAGIFLMKNNMGYADKQEVVLTPNQQLGDQVPAEDLEKKYLEDVVGASSDYDSED